MYDSNDVRLKNRSKLTAILTAVISFGAVFVISSVASVAEDKTRFVIEDDCPVYCGPDESLYATSKLAKGASVEVYHETADGWSGVRPPAGSFDWVAADAGHLLPGGKTLQIVGNPTPAWMGTYEPIARDELKWQIQLKPTQKVVVVGEAIQPQRNAADRTWFKIQPPQGEFRWIETAKLVSKPLPSNDLSNNRTSSVVSADAKSDGFGPRENDDTSIEDGAVVLAAAIQRSNSPSKKYPSVARKTVSQSLSPVPDANAMKSELQSVGELPAPLKTLPAETSPRSLLNGPVQGGPGQAIGNQTVEQNDFSDPSSTPLMDQEYFDGQAFDGQIIDGQFIDGEVFDGEVFYENGTTCCDTCGVASGCDCFHATDPMSDFESIQGFANPKLRVHPIGKILGLIGLSIAEAEIVQPEPGCMSCGPGTPTMAFGASPPSPSPRFGDRFQHLPRPGRRLRATFGRGWIGDSPYSNTYRNTDINAGSEFATNSDNTNSNLISSRPWHSPAISGTGMSGSGMSGVMPPQVGANTILSSSHIQSRPMPESRPPFGTTDVALVNNEDLDSLHFSTPEIQQAMLDLSSIVARPMDQWSLIAPMNQAKNWIENTNDTLARGEARLLLDRIERFEGLRQRSMGTAGSIHSGNNTLGLSANAPITYAGFQRPVSSMGLTIAPIAAPSANLPPLDQARNPDGTAASDASGWLVEVFSQQPGQPEFALTDDAGGLIAYVVASPGMNLRRYLKQPVGIYGVKGYLPNLAARQITAERIVRVR